MSNHDREDSRSSSRDALERAWREASDEQPPSHVDAAIIAAARKSVPARGAQKTAAPVRVPPRNWLLHWQPLATAATVAGLAFILVQMLPRDATHYGQGPTAEKSVIRPERVFVPDGAPTQGAVPAPPTTPASPPAITEAIANDTAETADAATVAGETSADRRETVEPAMAGRAATAAVAAPSSSAREQGLGKAASLDAAAWAAKIAALHASGAVTAAAWSRT